MWCRKIAFNISNDCMSVYTYRQVICRAKGQTLLKKICYIYITLKATMQSHLYFNNVFNGTICDNPVYMLLPFTYNVNNKCLRALSMILICVTTITYNDDR